jgi:hypothetical protein
MRTWIVLWLASLMVVAGVASALTYARTEQADAHNLSGNDLGFRLEGKNSSGDPVGALMVRVDGKWVEAGFAPRLRRAKYE